MPTLPEKIRGMFLGVGIGDALGMPVESWDRERIKQAYPDGITEYKMPSGHKWFAGQPAGSWTDDTQLTIATAKGLIDGGGLDLYAQGKALCHAMAEAVEAGPAAGSGVPGWGYTTVRAVRNLANNIPVTESGKTNDPNLGHGNGVVIRIAPIAAWLSANPESDSGRINQHLVELSAMTHYTQQSAIATVVHTRVLQRCLAVDPTVYAYRNDLCGVISTAYLRECHGPELATKNYDWYVSHLTPTKLNMWHEFWKIPDALGMTLDDLLSNFGGGSSNVGHSLPFCYACFTRNHHDVELLYTIVEAGGDTDSNASIVGAMLGALYGEAIFPQHLRDGLRGRDDILALADEFCDNFGIK